RHRDAHVGLGGQVEDHLGAATSDQLSQVRRPDVELMEGHATVLTAPGVGQVGQRPCCQVVDHVNVVSLGQQPVHQHRTDKAGAAGDEEPHGATGSRMPDSSAPAATTTPSPITLKSATDASASTRAPRPTIELRTTAPGPIATSSKITEPSMRAPFP